MEVLGIYAKTISGKPIRMRSLERPTHKCEDNVTLTNEKGASRKD